MCKMSLVTCPECGKEVSETSKKCIHCGYKFKKNGGSGKKKAIIISIIAIILVAVGLSVFFVIKNKRDKELAEQREKKYIQQMEYFRDDVINGGATAEDLCNLVDSVWYNAINEKFDVKTNEYTHDDKKHEFYDFNTALSNLFESDEYSKLVSDLKTNKGKVDEMIAELKEYPNEKYKEYFDCCYDLYNEYTMFYNFATNASGSYKEYSEKFTETENIFLEKFNKLKNNIELLKK